ncbi:MAG: hypothetical protein KJO55_01000 [Gammaproteobacteria bacterium]|nr:hypothetical protein [Gammaproteobacteria bacterium]NND60101.1 hypothetical protein [Gammaproteobacteria bacterium]
MRLWLAVAGLALPLVASAVEAPSLQGNPFNQPEWLSTARTAAGPAITGSARRRLDLRATLVAGKNSAANVGGKIVMLGEEIAGYSLIEVGEGIARFRYGDETISVSVAESKESESEN